MATASQTATRTLLYCWVTNGFSVLVPKQRGTGYLKVPYGHHNNEGLTHIANAVGCDVTGLDGDLAFDSSEVRRLYVMHEGRKAFAAKLVPMLEQHYQMNSREIDREEYWRLHPTQ